MGDRSTIEWTDATWNPMVGCSKVSPGCDNCYAIGVAHRGLSVQHRGLTVRTEGATDWNGEVNLVPGLLDQPLRWKRPRRIFVNSLSDLFHPKVPTSYIARVFAVMAVADQHTFQVLTKRPNRMDKLLNSIDFWRQVAGFAEDGDGATVIDCARGELPNVWLGVSIENNATAWRADHLRSTPAAVRWVSAEPLLGPLDELDLTGIDWVVAGGESGPGARPMHPEWLCELRDRCANSRCARCGGSYSLPLGVTCDDHHPVRPGFHFKQWGDWSPEEPGEHRLQTYQAYDDEGGPTTMMWRAGKKVAGRVLDGRTWDEYPS